MEKLSHAIRRRLVARSGLGRSPSSAVAFWGFEVAEGLPCFHVDTCEAEQEAAGLGAVHGAGDGPSILGKRALRGVGSGFFRFGFVVLFFSYF